MNKEGNMNTKMKITKPSDFRIKISNIGTNTFNGSYKLMTDTNALRLGYRASKIISEDLTGKELSPSFQYALACLLLQGLDYNKKDLQKNIDLVVKKMKEGAWEIKKS